MENKVITAMANDYRLSKEYLDGYMSTIEAGNVNANVKQDVVEKLNTNSIINKSNSIFEETHMAGNAIYSKDYQRDEFEQKLARKSKQYNRAKTMRKASKDMNQQLDEEELEMLNF